MYAGLYRGIYISFDRGESWSVLGTKIPVTSVSDLEIHTQSGDLIAATHGRGIYKLNLNPIYSAYEKGIPLLENTIFNIPDVKKTSYE